MIGKKNVNLQLATVLVSVHQLATLTVVSVYDVSDTGRAFNILSRIKREGARERTTL